MTAPERSLKQRRDALGTANATRSWRAALKRSIHEMPRVDATRRAADLVREPPPLLATWKVGEFVLAVPGIGTVKASAMLRKLAISPARSVGALSIRQRFMLSEALDELATMRAFPSASAEYQRLARTSSLV